MNAVAVEQDLVPARPEPRARLLTRAVLQRLVLLPVVRWFCRPLIVRGAPPVLGPVVFAATHASHADTLVLLRSLPTAVRARTHPAAAEDYFFRTRFRGTLTRVALGAFPFPRRGRAGLARAEAILAAGGNVVLFPEGTRSTDGGIGAFKAGVGVLAARGWTVVPVGLVGTRDVLAKGGRIPRRASVVVSFGAPLRMPGADPRAAAARIERAARATVARERLTRPAATRTWYARVRTFARTPAALGLLFCWGAAEAIALPIVPDLGLVLLAVAAPARAPALIGATLAGSLAGGSIAYAIGSPELARAMPLVTERMADAAHGWLVTEGAAGMAHQPWTGVPFKAFGLQASTAGVPLPDLLAATALHRGMRFAAVGCAFAIAGTLGRRMGERLYAPAALAGIVVFGAGLARVVEGWS